MVNVGYDIMDWGVGSALTLAIDPLPAPTARADRWSTDLHAVLGVTPTQQRVIAGWPHLQPGGPDSWDRRALDHCARGIDHILASGGEPVLTLSHHDVPDWLDAPGGWLHRETAFRFAEFAAEIGGRFRDRVARWVTTTDLSAPSVADRMAGMFGPSRGHGLAGLPAVHHLLLGHGLAVRALHAAGARDVGGTIVLVGCYPATDDKADLAAAHRAELWANRLFLDPLLLARHVTNDAGDCPVADAGCVRPGDLDAIATPQDSLHVSWYTPVRVTTAGQLPWLLPAMSCYRAINDLNRVLVRLGFAIVPFEDVETGPFGWPLQPEALADALGWLLRHYGRQLPPVRVVDNGMGDPDDPARRRTVLARRLGWLSQVIALGLRVRGYEYWSVLDNLAQIARYARLYSLSAPSGDPPRVPDWTHSPAIVESIGDGQARSTGRALHVV